MQADAGWSEWRANLFVHRVCSALNGSERCRSYFRDVVSSKTKVSTEKVVTRGSMVLCEEPCAVCFDWVCGEIFWFVTGSYLDGWPEHFNWVKYLFSLSLQPCSGYNILWLCMKAVRAELCALCDLTLPINQHHPNLKMEIKVGKLEGHSGELKPPTNSWCLATY